MKYLLVKDNKRRQFFFKFYIKKILFKFYLFYKFNLEILFYIYLKLKKFKRNSSIVRLNNRCIVSARANVLYKFKYSRFVLKKLLNEGKILAFKKASW